MPRDGATISAAAKVIGVWWATLYRHLATTDGAEMAGLEQRT
jgi:hypothetical protein